MPQLAQRQNTTQVSGGICSVLSAPHCGHVIVALYSMVMVTIHAGGVAVLEPFLLARPIALQLLRPRSCAMATMHTIKGTSSMTCCTP